MGRNRALMYRIAYCAVCGADPPGYMFKVEIVKCGKPREMKLMYASANTESENIYIMNRKLIILGLHPLHRVQLNLMT